MAELKLTYHNLSQQHVRRKFAEAAAREPFNMVLENCALDPIIFEAPSIVSLTIVGSTLALPTWCSRNAPGSPSSNAWMLLHTVILSQCTSTCWQTVLDSLPCSIIELHLSGNKGDFSRCTLSRFSHLSKLDLTNMRADRALEKAPFADSLRMLHLDNCMLTTAQLPAIARQPLSNNRLTTRGDQSVECLSSLRALTMLNLDTCGLQEMCGIFLSRALREMNKIESLNVAHNNGLRSTGMTFIVNALPLTINTLTVEFKAFARDKLLPIDHRPYKCLDRSSREWMEQNCRKVRDYVVKTGKDAMCYECYNTSQQHTMKCADCRAAVGPSTCVALAAIRCTHNKECAVCMDTFQPTTKVMELGCHHVFCYSCIMEWTKKNHICPSCRKPIVGD